MAKKKPKTAQMTAKPKLKEHLSLAKFLPPSHVQLVFGDGFDRECDFNDLEIDPSQLNLITIKASKSGAALEVKSTAGKKVVIDSTAIRLLVDPQFAAELEEATKAFEIPIEELKEIAKTHRPPQWWYANHDE